MTCPFCGSMKFTHFDASKPHPMSFVECLDCNAQGPTGKDHEDAIRKWKLRKTDKDKFSLGYSWWRPTGYRN